MMLIPLLSLFATVCTAPLSETSAVPFATQEMIAVVRDKNTVVLCDPATGRWLGSARVAWSDGEIVGQPVLNGNRLTVTVLEKGRTMVRIYEIPSFRLLQTIYP